MAAGPKRRIIVCGFMGLFPAGGAVWDYIQYPVALAALGHDVFYIEDTGVWPVFRHEGDTTGAATAAHIETVMADFGLAGRWAYRDEASGQWFGKSQDEVCALWASADMILSVSCSAAVRDEWSKIPVRAVIDSDPMFTQIQCATDKGLTPGAGGLLTTMAAYTHHFTFGENYDAEDCRMPSCGIDWKPTRQPVCLDLWPVAPPPANAPYTTVMNWNAATPQRFEGESWGQKSDEFDKIIDLPASSGAPFEIVVNGADKPGFPRAEIEAAGWRLADPFFVTPDWRSYRDYLAESRGEVSVAKHAYVLGRTGWFSCRTACYLAAGRPAVVQDTGWSHIYPTGEGLFAFNNGREALEAIQTIEEDPARHQKAARELAEHEFDGLKVTGDLLARCGLV